MFWILVLAGLLTGILINLIADSLPVVRRLRAPVCATCGQPRRLVSWSGLIGYASRQHRCPHCRAPLPMRHLIVELVTPLLFVFCWTRSGATITTWLNILYSAILVLITVTDMEHHLILHAVSLPAIALAVIGAYLNPAFDSPKRALPGGAIGLTGALILYFTGMLFASIVSKRRGQPLSGPAFGFGDVTLSTFLGLIVGAPEIIFGFVIEEEIEAVFDPKNASFVFDQVMQAIKLKNIMK